MVGRPGSVEDWGFDERNYVGQFTMDITTKEKGCFIRCDQEARNSSP